METELEMFDFVCQLIETAITRKKWKYTEGIANNENNMQPTHFRCENRLRSIQESV